MSGKLARCYDCDHTFSGDSRHGCPRCGSQTCTPFNPDYTLTEDADTDEFSGSKSIDDVTQITRERPHPQPDVEELHLQTADGWEYIFRQPDPADGHELYEKYRPDESISEDDVVPVSVAEYIETQPHLSLNYAKLVVHPSDDIYTPPNN
ncbi:hypothetical protein PNP59_09905 [Halobacterium salinarum]|uniref:hypothetical protein n=1 Tax=Halobacterium salinarum TaxID=2242 RepID=UPI002554670A|nr:hypothetical protein [Halobacterium salinarum]MDL0131244.1 hypothetical protein [Halobacterium salinarum]